MNVTWTLNAVVREFKSNLYLQSIHPKVLGTIKCNISSLRIE